MADERRRYLAQQIELGGAEIILGRRASAQAEEMPTDRPSRPSPESPAQPVAPAAAPPGAEDLPKWKRGAPPIPGCVVMMWTRPAAEVPQSGRSAADAATATVLPERPRKEPR